ATGNSFPFPDCLVHFDTQGKTSQSSAVSGINGLVTVQWTPENDNDRLTAKLVNKDGQIISEAVFTPELDCGGNFTATGGGITINGITWATRNVGAPGTFVASPEDYGEYYQWNKGTTGFLLYDDYYASAYAEGNAWLPENDPCPAGWRVPTDAEFDNLIASTDHSWTSSNGVNGYRFGCGSNSLFLPAAGGRSGSDGSIGYAGSLGYYWSSTPYDSHGAHGLYFSSGYVYTSYFSNRAYGHSVRCVTE
ncbi:MAG: fibrobacter succinogenes major paralogous domain-containing protein, partial [Prevotellaceae bacterium]|nr:fibrobacter succinogenes major paralogous domain-containing protein [Prevotellaceae bacterium]